MNDEQLMQFDEQQARQQLNDEQLERYNELKKQELKEDIEEKEKEDNEVRAKGLKAVRQSKEDELTVEVEGLNFLADVSDKQIEKLRKLSMYEDKTEDDLTNEQVKDIKSDLIELLSDLNKDYSREEWDEEFGDAGLFTVAELAFEVVDEIENFTEQKKSRFEDGRRKTAPT